MFLDNWTLEKTTQINCVEFISLCKLFYSQGMMPGMAKVRNSASMGPALLALTLLAYGVVMA